MRQDRGNVIEDIRRTFRDVLREDESPSSPETQEIGDNSHLDGTAGVGEADNIQDANDAVDKFLADIVAQLVLVTDMDEDEAFDYVFDFLDSMDEKHLSALPDDDADPEELALWLGKATTLGIAAKILKTAQEE